MTHDRLGVAGTVSATLYSRERTGRGQLVTASLTRMVAWHVSTDNSLRLVLDREAPRTDRQTEDSPLWNNSRAGDGKAF